MYYNHPSAYAFPSAHPTRVITRSPSPLLHNGRHSTGPHHQHPPPDNPEARPSTILQEASSTGPHSAPMSSEKQDIKLEDKYAPQGRHILIDQDLDNETKSRSLNKGKGRKLDQDDPLSTPQSWLESAKQFDPLSSTSTYPTSVPSDYDCEHVCCTPKRITHVMSDPVLGAGFGSTSWTCSSYGAPASSIPSPEHDSSSSLGPAIKLHDQDLGVHGNHMSNHAEHRSKSTSSSSSNKTFGSGSVSLHQPTLYVRHGQPEPAIGEDLTESGAALSSSASFLAYPHSHPTSSSPSKSGRSKEHLTKVPSQAQASDTSSSTPTPAIFPRKVAHSILNTLQPSHDPTTLEKDIQSVQTLIRKTCAILTHIVQTKSVPSPQELLEFLTRRSEAQHRRCCGSGMQASGTGLGGMAHTVDGPHGSGNDNGNGFERDATFLVGFYCPDLYTFQGRLIRQVEIMQEELQGLRQEMLEIQKRATIRTRQQILKRERIRDKEWVESNERLRNTFVRNRGESGEGDEEVNDILVSDEEESGTEDAGGKGTAVEKGESDANTESESQGKGHFLDYCCHVEKEKCQESSRGRKKAVFVVDSSKANTTMCVCWDNGQPSSDAPLASEAREE